jgi:hypothetical protein
MQKPSQKSAEIKSGILLTVEAVETAILDSKAITFESSDDRKELARYLKSVLAHKMGLKSDEIFPVLDTTKKHPIFQISTKKPNSDSED